MADKIKVDIVLDDTERLQLKELYSHPESERILTLAHDFFDFDFQCRTHCEATITFQLTNTDKTGFGATLRKITKPSLLNLAAKGREKAAIAFLEHLLGSAILSLRNYNCPHSRECIDFVAEKCNLNSSAARRKSRKTCLGFSCTQCRFFNSSSAGEQKKPETPDIYFDVRQENSWNVSLQNIVAVPLEEQEEPVIPEIYFGIEKKAYWDLLLHNLLAETA